MKKKTTLLEPVKYKSFSHWFSYHWGIIPIALLALFLIWFSWKGKTGAVDTDYTVGWVGASMLTEEEEAALSAAIAACGEDLNGDGEVTVEICQYVIQFDMDATDDNAELNYNYVTKLVSELQTNRCYLYFLEDPEGFQRCTGVLQYLDGSAAGEEDNYDCANWAEMCVPFQTAGFEKRTCWVGRRALFAEDADYSAAFPGGEALFQALAGLD